MNSSKSLKVELQETKQKLAEYKQIASELNITKKNEQQILAQFNALQTEYESEKKIAAQTLKSYNDKCTDAENKLLEAQKIITDLESNMIILKQDNEKSLKEFQGFKNILCAKLIDINFHVIF